MNKNNVVKLKSILEDMASYQQKLEDRYDEKSQNEPESDYAYEKWEEVLGSLEDKKDDLLALNDEFEEFIDSLSESKKEKMEHIFNKYDIWNSSYSGITEQLNKLEKLIN